MYRKTAKKLLKFIEKAHCIQAVTEMTKRLDKGRALKNWKDGWITGSLKKAEIIM